MATLLVATSRTFPISLTTFAYILFWFIDTLKYHSLLTDSPDMQLCALLIQSSRSRSALLGDILCENLPSDH